MTQLGSIVLLVEDSAGDVFREMLKELGRDVELQVAETGDAAIRELASGESPSLLVVDLNLPGGRDGEAVVREVRASDDPRLSCSPIVVMSSSAAPYDIRRCLRAGASAYVNKKLMLEEFQRDLQAMLSFWLETAALP